MVVVRGESPRRRGVRAVGGRAGRRGGAAAKDGVRWRLGSDEADEVMGRGPTLACC